MKINDWNYLEVEDPYWIMKTRYDCVLMLNSGNYPEVLRTIQCQQNLEQAGYQVPGVCEAVTGKNKIY